MNCHVIGDLLPLCADGVATPESQKLVEEHLLHCSSCRALYAEMCAPMEVQATVQERDYMAAVKRQNRRFFLRLYGSLLAVILLLTVGWFVREMFRNQGWHYALEPISREIALQEMPQVLLTDEEIALAGQIFSLPEMQQFFAAQPSDNTDLDAAFRELIARNWLSPGGRAICVGPGSGAAAAAAPSQCAPSMIHAADV